MQKILLVFLVAAIATSSAVLGALLVIDRNTTQQGNLRGATDSVAFTAIGTSSPMTVGTSASVQVLATSTSVQWRTLQNNSPFSVYLSLKSDQAAVANQGILLAASSTITFSLDASNMYRGSIQAISTGGTAVVLVNQY